MSPTLAERLPEISHGQHCCLIFSSPEEQAEITVPFLAIGLERGERSVYVGDPDSVERLRQGLRERGVDVGGQERKGRLVLSSERDYLDRGHFSTEKMLSFLQQAYDSAMADGVTALRAAGNVAWQLGPDQDFKEVVYYETLLDLFFLGKRMVGMCQYPKHQCPSEVLAGILNTHKTAALGREICSNFHYVPPELLLEKDGQVREARRVEWMSSQLVRARQAEEERDRLQAQLAQSQKLEAVGRLAGGVAHDFNNLLTVILGYNSLALEGLPAGDPSRDPLQQVQEAGERARALTRQLLAFSRRQILQPQMVELNALVAGAEKTLRGLAGPASQLALSLRPGLWQIRADPVQMEQVLMNLVVNARDAMPAGGQLTVETANVSLDEGYARSHAGARPGPHVMLAVSDTGVGMDEETRSRIFEPFFTTKEAGKGTGLGLSTVFGIVNQSGGNIWVYSEPGRGTCFKVYFPKAEGASPEPPPTPVHPAAARRGTVLVAEDQPTVLELIQKVLGKAGHQVLAAANAGEALRLCQEHRGEIDVLLADLVLPGLDGRELAALARARRPGMKVAFMSGYTDEAVARQGLLEPGTVFLEKPLLPDELLTKVQSLF